MQDSEANGGVPEVGTYGWDELLKDRVRKYNREEIAKLQAEALMAQHEIVVAAQDAVEAAREAENAARERYANLFAEAKQIRVGTRVRVTRPHKGPGSGPQDRTTVYKIERWAYSTPLSLRLIGRIVKKNGDLGDLRDVPGGWQRIPDEEPA